MFDGAALAEARCSARRADALALCPSPAVEDPHLLCAAFAVSWDLESTESLWSMRWHVMLNLHSAVVKGGDHPATAHHLAWTLASRYGYASLPYGARAVPPPHSHQLAISHTAPPHPTPSTVFGGKKNAMHVASLRPEITKKEGTPSQAIQAPRVRACLRAASSSLSGWNHLCSASRVSDARCVVGRRRGGW